MQVLILLIEDFCYLRNMTAQQKEERQKRIKKMLPILRKMFPSPQSELNYGNDFEFLVAVILSAQCTDKRVNIVTKTLFKKYKTISDYAHADLETFEQDIFSTGFYKNKAKNIIATAKIVQDEYKGKLPRNIASLQKLPGVGRKTANIILSNLYDIHEGIAVDTHVMRIAQKFDLVDPPYTPVSIEKDLMEIIPKKEWGNMNHYFVLYGRYYAPAHAKEVNDELTKLYPPARFKLKSLA